MDTPDIPINKDITYIGLTTFRSKNQIFGIKRKDRRQHMYLLGKSGTGKSALMTNLVMQNIINGDGVCVVDPHGELVEGIVSSIPPHRMKDVIYFNPADTDFHIGFNVLELIDPKYKHLVASGLMGIFTKIWANAWSARMEYILNNAILALLDTPGSTLLGIPRMLVDKDFRQKIINNLKDPVIKAFWIHEYEAWQDKFRNEAIAPIQNKVGQFLSTSIIRNVVGQAKSTINIFDIMNQGKIFLVNVSKGRIGEDNSALLGGMLITKIQLAAMERVRIPEDQRKDFYLYVDEFQNFVTDSFASILSEARKYRLNLTVAHQYTAQLVTANGSAVRDAIFGNVGTMIVFRVGADDADFLEKEFEPEFMAQDIVNLPNYRIYLKLMIDGVTSRPFSAKTLPPMVKAPDQKIEQEVIDSSRALYARSKEEIEREINEWSGMALGDVVPASANTTGEKFPVICSICMKETTVPFKPEANRPVYCKDCVAKMKSGELKPLKGYTQQVRHDESKFFKPLSDLGIEFGSDGKIFTGDILKTNAAPTAHQTLSKNPNIPTPPEKKGIFSGIKKVFQGAPQTQVRQSMPQIQNKFENKNIPQKPKENFALKEILNKALSETIPPKPTPPPVPAPKVEEIKKPEIPAVSLDTLKAKPVPSTSPLKDKSASSEDMDKFKSFIFQKIEHVDIAVEKKPDPIIENQKTEPVVIPEVKEIKIEKPPEPKPVFVQTPPPVNVPVPPKAPEPVSEAPKTQQQNTSVPREVPEEVLRKILQE